MAAKAFISQPVASLVAASSIAFVATKRRVQSTLQCVRTQRHISDSSSSTVHLIVLVHGWLGNESELGYFGEALLKQAGDDSKFVVYPATANVGNTHDGIAPGGERLAEEITEQVKQYKENSLTVTLSIVGNSLGGLYARYALSKLDMNTVEPFVFCTTATPHLGVSEHTYLPIPRWAEMAVAKAMKPTGSDLFRCTDLLERMAREPKFIEPLAMFRKRISYANAFWTDFQVPTTTAAFLSEKSSYPHVPVESSSSFVALKVETPPNQTVEDKTCDAQALDSLGWTKVFCDVRKEIPVPSVPLKSSKKEEETPEGNDDGKMQRRDSFTSQELIPMMTKSGERWHFPLGHTVLVANSKSDLVANINSNGRPIVDQLAADLIDDIREMENTLSDRRPTKKVAREK